MRRGAPFLALSGVLGLALVAFLWRLGASSLFVDETYSWRAATASFFGVFRQVRKTEVAPPLYYLLLHLWTGLGAGSEWSLRFLSVMAGVALVAAVWWLGRLLAGPAAGLAAAAVTALSPLVVQYAQEVRGYVFVMLATTVAVAVVLEAVRRPEGQRLWLGVAGAASVAAIWFHYTGLLVIAPLAVFVWTEPRLTRSRRQVFLMACALAFVIVAPLMVIQLRAGHQGGVAPFAHPTTTNVLRVLGTPFDGNFPPHPLTYIPGAVAVVAALAFLLSDRGSSRERRLLLAAAVTPLAAVVAVNLAAAVLGQHTYYSLITRYTAPAAPFIAVAIALALTQLPRLPALTLACLVAVSVVSGLAATYSSSNEQPNLRAAFATITRGYRPGDAVVLTGLAAQRGQADYYVAGLRDRRPGALVLAGVIPSSAARVWVISDSGSEPGLAATLARRRWRVVRFAAVHPALELTQAAR